jgi:hypothetical protein
MGKTDLESPDMRLNAWIGLLIVLVPALGLASIAGVVRICRLVIAAKQSEHTSRGGTGNPRRIEKERFPRTPSPLRSGQDRQASA